MRLDQASTLAVHLCSCALWCISHVKQASVHSLHASSAAQSLARNLPRHALSIPPSRECRNSGSFSIRRQEVCFLRLSKALTTSSLRELCMPGPHTDSHVEGICRMSGEPRNTAAVLYGVDDLRVEPRGIRGAHVISVRWPLTSWSVGVRMKEGLLGPSAALAKKPLQQSTPLQVRLAQSGVSLSRELVWRVVPRCPCGNRLFVQRMRVTLPRPAECCYYCCC